MNIYKTGVFHHKNEKGFQLLSSSVFPWNKETDGVVISNDIHEELIYTPSYARVIMGPGVDFSQALSYFGQYRGEKQVVFNCLSPWLKALFDSYAPNPKVRYECIPFPVDVDKFSPTTAEKMTVRHFPLGDALKKRRFFVYYKHVHSSRLRTVMEFLSSRQFFHCEYRVFTYGQYNEEDYLNYIREAEFGVWIGSHESQGFALEEALSCGCPLFVYDVKSLKDECMNDTRYPWGHLQGDFSATSASYFDDTCGVIVKEAEDIPTCFETFYNRRFSYRPREYVLNHLTATHFYEKIQSLFP